MNCNHQPRKGTIKESQTHLTPAVDIYETEAELVLLAELPGVTEAGLQLQIDSDILTLEGAMTGEGTTPQHHFYRQFRLNDKIDGNSGKATLQGGVLTLRLPKTAAAEPKKIAVRTLH